MKKINKYFLALITAFSLILSSCGDLSDDSGEKTVQKEKSPFGGISCIKVLLDSASVEEARTAFPDFTTENASDKESRYAGFTQFYLEGTRNSSKVSKTWTQTEENGTVTKTAYRALLDDQYIPLTYPPMEPPETWEFTLKGYYGGTFDTDGNLEDGSFILFEGKKTITTAEVGEVNEVSFELSRTSKYVFDVNKTGSLAITLNCGESNGVSTIKAKLYKAGDTENPAQLKDESTLVYATEKEYKVADLPEGQYYADFELYGKDSANREIFICSTREYAYVINNLASKSTLNIDPNGTFTISYKYNDGTSDVDFASLFASGYNAPSHYTRLSSETTLPVTGDFDSENDFIKNHIFLGWYETSDTSFANRITKIEQKSRVGNLDLKARFVHKNEVPTVLGVKFTYDDGVTADETEHPLSGLLKVGHKITATPYYNDDSSDVPFLGTIASWKWYYGEGESWTEIPATDVTIDTDASNADSTPASSSIWLKPTYAKKKIKVEVVQKYTITANAQTSGVYDIETNSTEKSTEAGTVAKGTLFVKDAFKLQYNKSIAVLCGYALSNDVLNQDVNNVVKTNVCDDNNQSSDSWTLSGLGITPTLAFAEGVTLVAPDEETGSKCYDVVLKADGYEDLSLTGVNGAYISVKYKKPTKEVLPIILWGKANLGGVAEDKILDCIDKGKVAFMKTEVSTYHNTTIFNKTLTPTACATPETMAATGSKCQIVSSDLQLGINNNGVNNTNTNAKGYNIGYIADSETYVPTESDLVGYIGTREMISKIALVRDRQVGKAISFKMLDSSEKQITQYTDICWIVEFLGAGVYNSTGATSESHTVKQADWGENGKGRVTAYRDYPYIGRKTIELGSFDLQAGEMTQPRFSYAGPAKKSGDSVTMSELNPSTFTTNTDSNNGAQINCRVSSITKVSAEDGASTGSVEVTVSATGYDSKTVTVTGIPIKPNPPAVGKNQEVTVTDPVTGAQTTVTLKTNSLKEGDDRKTVSIGHVAFNATLAPTHAYEFTRTYFESLKDYYESMTMDQLNAVYITKTAEDEDTRTQTLIDNIQQEFDRCLETGWHSIPVDTNGDGCFEKPLVSEYYTTSIGQSQFISLRSKMKGLVDGLYENIVYYDTGTNTWHTPSFTDLYTATEFSNDGTKCTVKDSDGRVYTVNITQHASEVVDVPYSSFDNDGIRGIKNAIVTVEKADLKLSGARSGGTVTFKLAEDLTKNFTITRWKVDGMSVANFKKAEGISTGVVEVLGSPGTEAKLEFTLSDLKDGTYQITAYGTDEYGIEHIGGASIVVSN
ncbi:hypothetical protein DYE50_01175 [Treponema ruminis]|uniref:Uncharacterized protein n=1 Tax=Treponema ruminis TaxID=744515 RepID=A0A7W8GBD9_9SPIR|nr:hypothetical protein [Treponema ruminis]MBB5227291.1 hypothetical protein [Treponema ruminis]QSI01195.1 hypothetical protein DYE50_01175 [Treponema ruminis]